MKKISLPRYRTFEYIESNSFLHKLNPTLKFFITIIIILLGATILDPLPLLIFMFIGLIMIFVIAKIPVKVYLKVMSFFIFMSIMYFIFYSIIYSPEAPPAFQFGRVARETMIPHMELRLGFLRITSEGMYFGSAVALRILNTLTWAMMFIFTTHPKLFIISLIQHMKLNYRVGFAIFAGYRFMPLLNSELELIRIAHAVRGYGEKTTLRGRLKEFMRYTVPLFASAVRKAQRTAIAMESKAFGAFPKRTYLTDVKLRKIDVVFTATFLIVIVIIYILMIKLGLIRSILISF
ncbi:MAG: energy-coupling factor transporter transmembrane component T [Candidatus Methanomethylicia archaeon]